jgi:hypothetical protein
MLAIQHSIRPKNGKGLGSVERWRARWNGFLHPVSEEKEPQVL